MLQALLTCHLPDPIIRNSLRLPRLTQVDMRAACFCHGKVVDNGYVCPVCLAVYCEESIKCATCLSLFPRTAPTSRAIPLPRPPTSTNLQPSHNVTSTHTSTPTPPSSTTPSTPKIPPFKVSPISQSNPP